MTAITTAALKRRTRAKGRWMRLTNPELLADYMERKKFSQARMARYAEVSRQFIWKLLNDPKSRSCTPDVATRIEEALDLIPGTLFVASVSPEERQPVAPEPTGRTSKASISKRKGRAA